MQFSRNQDIKKMILRGLNLILSWFLLKVSYIYPLGVLFAKSFNLELVQFCIAYVFNSDILFFAGAFFIYYAILKKLKVSDLGLLLISLVLFTLGNIIYFKSDSILLENLIGEFVWTDETCFPFINWVMAPTLGVFFGKALIRCKNKNALYSFIGVFSALILFMIIKSMEMMDLLGVESINAYSEVDFFYHTNYLTLLFSFACLGVFMSLSYLLSKLLGRKLLNVAAFVSYHVNHIYIMQWVIIPWLALILPRQTEKVSPLLAFEITAVIFVFCTLVILLYQKVFKKAKK